MQQTKATEYFLQILRMYVHRNVFAISTKYDLK